MFVAGFPELTNAEIFDAVKKSSSKYNNPDDRVGYGIPNMRIAYEILSGERLEQTAERILGEDWLKAYPVPFTTGLTLLVKPKRPLPHPYKCSAKQEVYCLPGTSR